MLGAEAPRSEVTLPPAEEREWLIERTAETLAAFGWRGYVLAPLLEPTPSFFPDPWAGGEASVRRVLRRLLRYADAACSPERRLAELEVALTLHSADPARRGEVVNQPPMLRGHEARAWFVGFDARAGILRFAVEEVALREPENLVPALARAVAHAARAVHGMVTGNDLPGQRLIDVAGFALGFGLLTTDASQRFYARSSGMMRSQRAEARLGALSVQDMSFLLALQAHVRGLDRKARRRVLDRLQANQAGFFREAGEALSKVERLAGKPLRERLGVPAAELWPAPPSLERLTAPLSEPTRASADERDEAEDEGETDEEPEAEERRDLDRGVLGMNEGKPVFRVERSGALRMAKLLGFPVLLLGGLLSRGNFGIDLPMEIVMPSAVTLAVAGLALGSLFTDRRCSEPKCGRALKPDDEVCPLCGGRVMGVIHDPRERLGAEEELVRQGKVGPDGLLVERDDEDDESDEDEELDEAEQPDAAPVARVAD